MRILIIFLAVCWYIIGASLGIPGIVPVAAQGSEPTAEEQWYPPLPPEITVHYHASKPCAVFTARDARMAGVKFSTFCW